jgi:ABC-type lipoprotein export system ATPase subunit
LSAPLIELRNVVKTYTSAAGSFTALRGIDLEVDRGQFVAVIGKSGSGKSTLINMLAGIDRPTSGGVFVNGTAVHELSESGLARWRGRNLGVVFQFFQLLPTLTVAENVMLPMDFCDVYAPRERRRKAMELLDLVGMAPHADKLPAMVSGGQQQRVAIARALANDPPLIVADEPTGNLDSKMAESIFQLFEELVRGGKTIVMVTHDNDLAQRATRAVIVADGEVVNQYVAQALSTLDLDQMTLAASRLAQMRFPAGAVLFKQGDPADRVYVITAGAVDIVIQHPGGQEIVVNTLRAGTYFGEVGVLQGGTRTATVRADEGGVEVMTLDRETFQALVQDSEPTRDQIDQALRRYTMAEA